MILYLRDGELPDDVNLARRIVTKSALYTLADNILYHVSSKSSEIPQIVVPVTFQQQVMMGLSQWISGWDSYGPHLSKHQPVSGGESICTGKLWSMLKTVHNVL